VRLRLVLSWPAAALTSVTLFAACVPKIPGNPDIPRAFCEPRCTRRHDCDPRLDTNTCTADCIARTNPRAIYVRPDRVADIRGCAERQTCSGDVSASIRSCELDAWHRLQPTARAVEFCNALPPRSVSCQWKPPTDVDHCLDSYKGYIDPVLAQLEACLRDSPCRFIDSCFYSVLGEPGVDYSPERERIRESRPVPREGPPTVSLTGRVLTETGGFIEGASVCVQSATPRCVQSDLRGAFTIQGPAHDELALTAGADGYGARLLPLATAGRGMRELVFSLPTSAASKARYETLSARAPDDSVGSLVMTVLTGALPIGVKVTLTPPSGGGPLEVSSSETAGTRKPRAHSAGVTFAGVTPGPHVLTVDAPPLTCVPASGGWPADGPGAIRVPIAAGFETVVVVECR
jgi:hypothetical protein